MNTGYWACVQDVCLYPTQEYGGKSQNIDGEWRGRTGRLISTNPGEGFTIHRIRDVEYAMREVCGSGARREGPDKNLQVGYQSTVVVRIDWDNC